MNLKKTFAIPIILLTMLLSYTACSDKENGGEAIPEMVISDLTKSYETTQLIINNKEAAANQSIKVVATNDGKATITLSNLVENSPELILEGTITKNAINSFSIELTSTVNLSAITIKGYFTGTTTQDAKLTVILTTDEVPLSFEDIAKTYISVNYILGGIVTDEGMSSTVEIDKEGKGHISFTNTVVGEEKLKLPVTFKREANNSFSFETTSTNNDRTIVFKGDIKREGTGKEIVLNVIQELKITSPIVGKWTLRRSQLPESNYADFIFNFVGGTEEGKEYEYLNYFIPNAIGQQLYNAVDIVTLNFEEKGALKIYYKVPESSESSLPKLEIPLEFFIKGGKLNIAIPAVLIDQVLPALIPQGIGIGIDEIKSLFVKVGNHYALELSNTLDGDYNKFHIDAAPIIKGLAPVIIPLIPPEGFGDFTDVEWLEEVLGHFAEAESLTIGLGFDRIK